MSDPGKLLENGRWNNAHIRTTLFDQDLPKTVVESHGARLKHPFDQHSSNHYPPRVDYSLSLSLSSALAGNFPHSRARHNQPPGIFAKNNRETSSTSVTNPHLNGDPREAPQEKSTKKHRHKSRRKSEEERLREAQEVYDEILRTLSESCSVREDVVKKASTSTGSSYDAPREPPLRVPPLSLQNLQRPSREEKPVHADRSATNTKVLQSLRTALRPLKLKHPASIDSQLSPDNISFAEEKDEVYSVNRSESSDVVTESSLEPRGRALIDELWNGYVLKYPEGKLSTPQWQVDNPVKMDNGSGSVGSDGRIFQELREMYMEKAWTGSLLPDDEGEVPKEKKTQKHARKQERKVLDSYRSTSTNSLNRLGASVDNGGGDVGSARGYYGNGETKVYSPLERPQSGPKEKTDYYSRESDGSVDSGRTWNVQPAVSRSNLGANQNDALRPSTPKPTGAIKPKDLPKKPTRPQPPKLRGRSLDRYLIERMEREVSDLAEMRNQFRANPVPPWVKEQKYDQLVQEAKLRKVKVHERAQELLQQVQPFNFSRIPDREEKRHRVVTSVSERPKEVRSRRKVGTGTVSANTRSRNPVGAPELDPRITLPRTTCERHKHDAPAFRPVVNTSVPDFARLHSQLDRRKEAYKQNRNWSTVVQPFALTNLKPVSKADKEVENVEPLKRPRRSKSLTGSFGELVRPTRAFALLTEHSKQKLRKEDFAENVPDADRMERLQESLQTRRKKLSELSDSVSQQQKFKLSPIELKTREYMDQIAEVKRRLNNQPFMWERTQMEQRRKLIDTKFNEILENNSADQIFYRAVEDHGRLS